MTPRDWAVGEELPELRVTPDRHLTVRYAGASGDFNPIHVDDQFAQEVGLPGRILHGLYTMAQVARAQSEAGGGPQALARLAVTFRAVAVPERELVVSGSVRAVEGDRVIIDARVEQDGSAVVRPAEAELRVAGLQAPNAAEA